MKKIILLLITAIFIFRSNAQLVVNLQLPPVALTLKTQLWNMMLVNTSGQTIRIKAEITLTDISNNVVVMTASTAELDLSAGANPVQAANFMPVVYNVVSPNYNIDNNPNGFLPVGHFNVCYQFDRIINDYSETLTDECEAVEIEPISPPMLVFPEDEAVIEFPRPVFNWIPPAPAGLFSNLGYDLRLVEVTGIQSPADAMQQNIALYAEQNTNLQSAVYPAGLTALDTGKLYAWQVTAKNNNSFIAKSDIWVFRVGMFGTEGHDHVSGEPFAKLRLDGGANYFLCTGALRFYYDNHLNDDTVSLTIYDLGDPEEAVYSDSSFQLQPGQNFSQVDIKNIEGFSADHFYLVELVNSRREKWMGKFLYKAE